MFFYLLPFIYNIELIVCCLHSPERICYIVNFCFTFGYHCKRQYYPMFCSRHRCCSKLETQLIRNLILSIIFNQKLDKSSQQIKKREKYCCSACHPCSWSGLLNKWDSCLFFIYYFFFLFFYKNGFILTFIFYFWIFFLELISDSALLINHLEFIFQLLIRWPAIFFLLFIFTSHFNQVSFPYTITLASVVIFFL